jgi:MinD-like ATPase involved in chromosome partitioning or flagellar assembly
MIRHELDASEVVVIPDDLAVVSADQAGQAPYDSAPDSAAVRAVGKLAERLSGDFAASNGHSSNGHSSNGHS